MNNDDKIDALTRQTEVWPDDFELPAGIESQEYIETPPDDSTLNLTWFSRKTTNEIRPAMVFVHGGSWKFGDKLQFYRQAARLAEKYNIFGVCISYRLSGEAKYPAALHDCKAAVRWTRSVADQFKVDPNRIGISGGSAGAHLAALVATTNSIASYEGTGPHQIHSSEVSLAVLFNGHYDMSDQLKDHIQDDAMHRFFGGHPWEIPGIYAEASPFLRVNEQSPPMLLLHGDQDHYPHRQSVAMAERLQHYGVAAEVEIYEGKEHAWFNKGEDNIITTERMGEFLAKHFEL